MGGVGPDLHQVRDRPPAASLGILFEELPELEEEHHEDRLRELALRPRQEAYPERPKSGDAHQEVLVQQLPLRYPFRRLPECIVTDNEVRDEVDEEQLPERQSHMVLYDYSHRQE